MSPSPSALPLRPIGRLEVFGKPFDLLGRLGSPRGVQIMTLQSPSVDGAEFLFKIDAAAFSYQMNDAHAGELRRDGRFLGDPGSLTFVPPDVSLTARSQGRYFGCLCVFAADFLADLSHTEAGLRSDGWDLMTAMQSPRLRDLGRTMFRETIEPGFASSLIAESIGLAIVVELSRYDGALRPGVEPRRGGLAAWQLARLDSYIRENLASDLTLAELALVMGMSIRHLSRAVRQEKGLSVHRWVAERRLAEARRLLAQTDLPIQEVARLCAFHSASAFTAAFRAASGYGPGEFKRLHWRGA